MARTQRSRSWGVMRAKYSASEIFSNKAISARPPVTSARPNRLIAMSGTPLPTKLGIKEGHRVAFVDAPENFEQTIGPLPDGAELKTRLRGPLDVIVFFTTSRAKLARRMQALRNAMEPDGRLWIAWPKKAANVPTDMTEDVVRDVALPTGLVDNKVAAIDETWSGLQLVIRLENRT
jgi:hypothetical protein